ncbi:MAG: glycosyltransferase, partial [Muribaculaceae bacterium]|nr:glycosyltransferase [Muribaculaceae bacterium]
ILPNVGDFRLLDRKAVNSLRKLRETQRYTKGLYCWVGYKKKEVSFDRADRQAGKSNFNLLKLINLAVEGVTSYTTIPLRVSIIAGLIVSILAFAYLLVMFTKTLIFGEKVTGYPSLMCVILFLGGMQLLALGIIGEYIGRIFNETKGRPPYVVESYNFKKGWLELM